MAKQIVRILLGLSIAFLLVVSPYVYYRVGYTTYKRLREVRAGVMYRSGQLTADGIQEAIERYGIRTIINLQNEDPDPQVRASFFNGHTTPESELCRQLDVRYVYIEPDLLHPRLAKTARPKAIEEFLQIMDEPANYPVLLHCRAGLHRTGCLTAVYRLEYENWTKDQAIAEVKANGFGKNCHAANEYIVQYILNYRPGQRLPGPEESEPAKKSPISKQQKPNPKNQGPNRHSGDGRP